MHRLFALTVAGAILAAGLMTVPLACATAHAQAPLTLVVAVDSRPPWKYMQEGKPVGADVDILILIAERLDVELEFKTGTAKQCLDMIKKGKADVISSQHQIHSRESYLNYVMPPYATRDSKAFYALTDRAESIERYEHLRGQVIGMLKGRKHFPQFDTDPELRRSPRSGFEANFKRLLERNISVFIADEAEADWWLSTNPKIAARIAKAPLGYQGYMPLHFAFSLKSPGAALADHFGMALAEFTQDGTLPKVLAKHGIRP